MSSPPSVALLWSRCRTARANDATFLSVCKLQIFSFFSFLVTSTDIRPAARGFPLQLTTLRHPRRVGNSIRPAARGFPLQLTTLRHPCRVGDSAELPTLRFYWWLIAPVEPHHIPLPSLSPSPRSSHSPSPPLSPLTQFRCSPFKLLPLPLPLSPLPFLSVNSRSGETQHISLLSF